VERERRKGRVRKIGGKSKESKGDILGKKRYREEDGK
jgi:hypothetical protein